MKTFLMVLTALALTGAGLYFLSAPSSDETAKRAFIDFKMKFNKSYGSKNELNFRFGVFKNALKRIEEVNTDSSKTYTLGVNRFADLTFEEFSNQYLNLKVEGNGDLVETRASVPKVQAGSVDWRNTKGAVGAVKDQAQCGSCWAFSTVASLEFQYNNATGKVSSFSEQELVDCATGSYGNYGCGGGLMSGAYDYIIDHNVDTEAHYPYQATDNACRANYNNDGRYGIKSYSRLPGADVSDLITAVDKQVVSVAIEVQYDFQLYTGGVFHADASCGDYRNHAVAAVGYDTSASDPYFIVRNSWNGAWGEQGYIRMAVATGRGTCGIVGAWDVTPDL